MNQRDESTVVVVDGKSLRLTHVSQAMFPDDGFTKAELLLYYQTIAPLLLPHLRGRPLTEWRNVPITGVGWHQRLPAGSAEWSWRMEQHRW